MNKKLLIEYFKRNGKVRVITPSHRYYGIDRKAEKIQTNSIKFELGSWLYFNMIKPENIFSQGFKIEDGLNVCELGTGYIEYAYCDMDIIKQLEGLK